MSINKPAGKMHDKYLYVTWKRSELDAITDDITNCLDKLANYCAGGRVLSGARDEIRNLRRLVKKLRKEA